MGRGSWTKQIDLLTSVDGVAFEECWPSRVSIDIGGLTVLFIDARHLVIEDRM